MEEDIWRAMQAAFEAAAAAASSLNAGGVTIVVAYDIEGGKFLTIKDLNCPDGSLRLARRQALEPVIRKSIMSLEPVDWNIVVKSDKGVSEANIDEEIAEEAEEAFYEELTA